MGPSRTALLAVWLFTVTAVASSNITSNTSISRDQERINCVYPLSGQYGFLSRLLYYLSLVLAILGRYKEWLVLGALASALAYGGSAAIHIMALATSKKPVYDLDILGCYAILSTGVMAYSALVHWSTTVRHSRARIILVLWGALVGTGIIFGRSELMDIQPATEPACRSSTGELLSTPYQLFDPQFNCTYQCFSALEPMRQQSETMAVPSQVLNGHYSGYSILLIGPVLAAAYKSISYETHAHSPSQLLTRFVMAYINHKRNEKLTQHMYNAASETWYGGYFLFFHYLRRAKKSWKVALFAFLIYPWLLLELAIDICTPPLFITNIVLNELNLMRSGLPINEQTFAIGQWAPMVSAVLVLIAAAINKFLHVREARKGAEDIPRDELPTVAEPSSEVASTDGQMTGVVVPELKHQETLKDMETILAASKKSKG